jgi:hypothetical protein
MALYMICSNWLVCGWLASLLVGAGVVIFQRQNRAPRLTYLQLCSLAIQRVKWDSKWSCYAKIRGRRDDRCVQSSRSEERGIIGELEGYAGSNWRYA